MTLRVQSELDQDPLFNQIKQEISAGESNASIARKYGKSKDAIRRFRKRHGLSVPTAERAGVKVDNDRATVVTPPSHIEAKTDPDSFMAEFGLDPEEWYIDSHTINKWDGPSQEGKITYYQAKLNLKRKKPAGWFIPARADGWTPPKRDHSRRRHDYNAGSELVVITGDQQAPYHDPVLHERFLDFLNENLPDRGVLLGDTVDYPDISRHPNNPEADAKVIECTNAGYQLLRDYVGASPDTEWTKLCGNHDERIRNYVINQAPALHGLARAATPEDPNPKSVIGVDYLLRLDELGIEYLDPQGPYDQTQLNLSKYLAVRHGWLAQKGAGKSALASLEALGHSIIVGHTHRQAVVHKTTHDISGKPTTITGVEAGCMCRNSSAPGEFPTYAVAQDWQQGFCTAEIWPDGRFKIDLATYFDGVLLWRNKRYE